MLTLFFISSIFVLMLMMIFRYVYFVQTGCIGCASGIEAGPRNIFGNKYGQNLAAVQIAREKRIAEIEVNTRTFQLTNTRYS